ncbi:hypothetical protein DFH27DRAFT_650578 [Peziza echinospora]|nr:hypothetical protein DFH27DRAFT_650578 [Peziza echinospora]
MAGPSSSSTSSSAKPVTLRFSTIGIEVIENRTWTFAVPFEAVSTLKKLCEQIGLCRDFIQDFDLVPSLVKTKFYIRDTLASYPLPSSSYSHHPSHPTPAPHAPQGAYIVSGNWEALVREGGVYEIILKPNREEVHPPHPMLVGPLGLGKERDRERERERERELGSPVEEGYLSGGGNVVGAKLGGGSGGVGGLGGGGGGGGYYKDMYSQRKY